MVGYLAYLFCDTDFGCWSCWHILGISHTCLLPTSLLHFTCAKPVCLSFLTQSWSRDISSFSYIQISIHLSSTPSLTILILVYFWFWLQVCFCLLTLISFHYSSYAIHWNLHPPIKYTLTHHSVFGVLLILASVIRSWVFSSGQWLFCFCLLGEKIIQVVVYHVTLLHIIQHGCDSCLKFWELHVYQEKLLASISYHCAHWACPWSSGCKC